MKFLKDKPEDDSKGPFPSTPICGIALAIILLIIMFCGFGLVPGIVLKLLKLFHIK